MRRGCDSALCVYGSAVAETLGLRFDTVKWRCQGSHQLSSSKSVSSQRSGQEEYFTRENFRQRLSPTSFIWRSTWGQRSGLRLCLIQGEERSFCSLGEPRHVGKCVCTWFSMALVCDADRQKRARASVIGVAGKPTTTTPIFLSSISRAKALVKNEQRENVPLFIFSLTNYWKDYKT